MLVGSENVVYVHSNYILVAWLSRCKGVEIWNKTLKIILCASAILCYGVSKTWLFFAPQYFYFWIETFSASKNLATHHFLDISL